MLCEAVSREVFQIVRTARDAFKNLPPRVSGILAAETDQGKIHILLTTEIHQILEGLSQ